MAEQDLRLTVLELLRLQRANEQEFMAGLDEADRAASGTPEDWCAKDVIAHITAWRLHTVARLRAALGGVEPPALGSDDEENAAIFAHYSERAWREVEAVADRSVAELADLLPGFSASDLLDGQRYAWLNGRPLLQTVLGNGVEHPIQHLGEFARARGQHERTRAQQERLAAAAREGHLPDEYVGIAVYNLACTYALTGAHDQALAMLSDALRLNPSLATLTSEDPDFASIRELPAFQALAASNARQ